MAHHLTLNKHIDTYSSSMRPPDLRPENQITDNEQMDRLPKIEQTTKTSLDRGLWWVVRIHLSEGAPLYARGEIRPLLHFYVILISHFTLSISFLFSPNPFATAYRLLSSVQFSSDAAFLGLYFNSTLK